MTFITLSNLQRNRIIVKLDDISALEFESDHTKIHLSGGQTLLVSGSEDAVLEAVNKAARLQEEA